MRWIPILFLASWSLIAQAQFPNTSASASWGSNQTEFLPVEQAYQLAPPSQDDTLRLPFIMAPGYYLYRHGFHVQQQGEALTFTLPDGERKHDEYFGEVEVYYDQVTLTLPPATGSAPLEVTSQGCADAGLCYPPYTLTLYPSGDAINPRWSLTPSEATSPMVKATDDEGGLLMAVVLAFLGGLILNLMPCVFPILSLKVLGFVRDHRHTTHHGLIYGAGVISSFVAIAALLLTLRGAGEAVGWGFQLQSPWLIAGLTYLFFLLALNLSGALDLGGSWQGLGGNLLRHAGYSSSFFTGVLAVVVASPCTAPFMGTALGYAITQPPLSALLIFAALGIGMAAPIVLLSCQPWLIERLPKPGQWMDQLKQLLAFPLYATVIWLAWVAGNQLSINAMAQLLLGCLLLAVACWGWRQRRTWGRLLALAALIGALWLPTVLHAPSQDSQAAAASKPAFSLEQLDRLTAGPEPVFVNITADWCITCLANERLTLSRPTIKDLFSLYQVTYLKGDWTNYDAEIGALLNRYGRSGIPLYLYFPGNGAAAQILPQLLNEEILIDAISGNR